MSIDNRKRYEFDCPVCRKKLWACKSMAQEMGMLEMGNASCTGCDTFLNLTVDEESDRMVAMKFEDYKEAKLNGVH